VARAVNAARDPAWTADGVVADRWEPVSPVTGGLDAFQWRVPVENRDSSSATVLSERLEELLAISAPKPVNPEPAAKAVPEVAAQPAPVRREDAVDAEAVTVRPEPIKITPQPAPAAKPAEVAAAKPNVTQIDAKTISPLQRASEVSIVKPAAKAEPPPEATPVTKEVAAAPRPAEPAVTIPSAASSPAAVTPAAQAKAATPAPKPAAQKTGTDAKIFVAPRAPDDPGTDENDDDSDTGAFPKRIYRAVN